MQGARWERERKRISKVGARLTNPSEKVTEVGEADEKEAERCFPSFRCNMWIMINKEVVCWMENQPHLNQAPTGQRHALTLFCFLRIIACLDQRSISIVYSIFPRESDCNCSADHTLSLSL